VVVLFAVAAFPAGLRAQSPARPGWGPLLLANAQQEFEGVVAPAAIAAPVIAGFFNLSQPAWADAGTLPPLPPSSADLFGRFREDLSKPLTPKQKLKRAIRQAIFPGLPASAGSAGIGMAVDTRLSRDYGMGARGFLRRWASGFGDNAVGLFVGDFAMASMLHQDPRYHFEKRRGFGRRLSHALAAVFVTQSDSGQNEFNVSHLTGLVVAAGASTAWHHASDRRADYFGERVGTELAGSAAYKVLSEFLFYRHEPRQ
jgi:hypothetical protein